MRRRYDVACQVGGFETFLRFINKTLDKYAPIKTVKKKGKKQYPAVDN